MKAKSQIMAVFLLASQLFVMAATAQGRNPTLDENITLRLGLFGPNLDAL